MPREVEVPNIAAKCARFPHVAQAHDRVLGSAAGLEQARGLLPWARMLALGAARRAVRPVAVPVVRSRPVAPPAPLTPRPAPIRTDGSRDGLPAPARPSPMVVAAKPKRSRSRRGKPPVAPRMADVLARVMPEPESPAAEIARLRSELAGMSAKLARLDALMTA